MFAEFRMGVFCADAEIEEARKDASSGGSDGAVVRHTLTVKAKKKKQQGRRMKEIRQRLATAPDLY